MSLEELEADLGQYTEIMNLASRFAILHDGYRKAREESNTIYDQLVVAREELLAGMRAAGTDVVDLEDGRCLSKTVSRKRKASLKELSRILGPETARDAWNRLPETVSENVTVKERPSR